MRAIAAITLALIIGIWSLATLLIEAIVTPVRSLAERIETGSPRAWTFFSAIRRMDPELGAMIKTHDFGPAFIREVLMSRTLMDVLDKTTVVKDLTPRVGEIEKALQEAKKIALEGR